MKISREDPVLIIGASLSGLCLAIALRSRGFEDVKIYDSKSGPQWNRSWVHIAANALTALEPLNLSDRIVEIGRNWERIALYWRTSDLLNEVSLSEIKEKKGNYPVSMESGSLLELLIKELPEDTIQWNHEFISFTPLGKEIEAHFTDNRVARGKLLIGAEEEQSRVRLQLFGNSPKQESKLTIYEGIVSARDLFQDPTDFQQNPYSEWIGPGQGIALIPLSIDKVLVRIIMRTADQHNYDYKAIQNTFEKWADPIPELIESLDGFQLTAHQAIDIPIAKRWYEDNIFLAACAAHPMLPFLFQDSSMEIESSIVLASLLAEESTLKKIGKAYESQRKKRVAFARRESRKRVEALYWQNSLAWYFRNKFMASSMLAPKAYQKLSLKSFH